MISRQKKEEIVSELTEKLGRVSGLYVLNYEGLKVADAINVRRAFKAKGIDFKVAKNNLIKRALGVTEGLEVPDDKLIGMTALVFGYDDPVAPAKILKEYLEKEKKEIPALKAAVIEGQLYDGSRLKELAALPSREDMIAGIIGSLDAPISGIVGSINAVVRDLASVIEEVAKQKDAA